MHCCKQTRLNGIDSIVNRSLQAADIRPQPREVMQGAESCRERAGQSDAPSLTKGRHGHPEERGQPHWLCCQAQGESAPSPSCKALTSPPFYR